MKCTACQSDNKDNAVQCRKCGASLLAPPVSLKEPWTPTWQWHARVLGGIYVVLIGLYFAITTFMSKLPPPYRLREIPMDVTPWLKK